jgi:hyaluronate lyase
MSNFESSARAALLLAALALTASVGAQSPDIALVRKNVVDYYTAAAGDRSDPRLTEALAALESTARSLTAPGFLRDDGSWTDIDYTDVPGGSWSPWDHFRRLTVLAKAYSTPGQALYHDPALRARIESVLSYLEVFYGPKAPEKGNWWFWTIGPALDLGPSLVLVSEDIAPAVRESATASLAAHIGKGPGLNDNYQLLEGQNAVWSALNHTMLAILKGDAATMARVRDLLTLECFPRTTSDGLRSDYSFQQHGPQLYTGGYGGSFAYEVSKYFLFARGTPWALGGGAAGGFADFMVEGIAWSLFHNYFDVSVIGREVAYPSASGFNGLAALLNMSAVASPRRGEIRAAAAKMAATWPGPYRTELAGLLGTLRGVAGAWPSGNRTYPYSDFTIHRRPGWYASIKMFSSRTESGEDTNGENLLGSRQSDGRLNLVVNGDEYFDPNVWPAFDWTRLPGTTVEQKPGIAGSWYGRGNTSFVGGTGNGKVGVAAMDVAPLGSSLRARKAWFFFDDSIVFLTSGIKCLSGSPVETVVDQRATAADRRLVVDGVPLQGSDRKTTAQWAAGEGIGYYFPGGATLRIRDEERTGTWQLLATWGSTEPVSRRTRSIVLEHGASVTNASAEYVMVPGKDANGMRDWAAARPVTILANDDTIAAARDERSGEFGIVFWRAGSIGHISSAQPAIVLVSQASRQLRLSVAEPSRTYPRVTITLAGRYRLASGDAFVTASGRSTTINVNVSSGNTTTIVLDDLSRVRGARR